VAAARGGAGRPKSGAASESKRARSSADTEDDLPRAPSPPPRAPAAIPCTPTAAPLPTPGSAGAEEAWKAAEPATPVDWTVDESRAAVAEP